MSAVNSQVDVLPLFVWHARGELRVRPKPAMECHATTSQEILTRPDFLQRVTRQSISCRRCQPVSCSRRSARLGTSVSVHQVLVHDWPVRSQKDSRDYEAFFRAVSQALDVTLTHRTWGFARCAPRVMDPRRTVQVPSNLLLASKGNILVLVLQKQKCALAPRRPSRLPVDSLSS
jgi:hypothetical protein